MRWFVSILICSLWFFFSGCGGGGTGGGSNSGLSSLTGSASKSTLVLDFASALNLSVYKVASDYDLSLYYSRLPMMHEAVGISDYASVLGFSPSLSLDQVYQLEGSSSYVSGVRKAVSTLKSRITQYKVTVTAPDLLIPVVAYFPSTQTKATIAVESGLSRTVLVEGIGSDIDGNIRTLAAAQAVVDLMPSMDTVLGGPDSSVPMVFKEIDSDAPITAIYLSGSGAVEGPHRQATTIILNNFEQASTIYYRVSEKNVPGSTLSAVTKTWKNAISSVEIPLTQEGIYLFEYFSVDASSNRETTNEKEITVDFNLNPPQTVIDYAGGPFFAGALVGLSIQMADSETGVLHYSVDGAAEKTSKSLKNGEYFGVQISVQGGAESTSRIQLKAWSEVNGGSVEPDSVTTEIEITSISVGGYLKTTHVGSANTGLGSGGTSGSAGVTFCDSDTTSIYADPVLCPTTKGKRVILLTGPFSPGEADDFPCVSQSGTTLQVVNGGTGAQCQSCSTYNSETGITCPF